LIVLRLYLLLTVYVELPQTVLLLLQQVQVVVVVQVQEPNA
jgi:hypothetical protein|tara:strand:+ start:285 stop:407 length:123 start_codon:yes stop_codon:yes gene_type:complete